MGLFGGPRRLPPSDPIDGSGDGTPSDGGLEPAARDDDAPPAALSASPSAAPSAALQSVDPWAPLPPITPNPWLSTPPEDDFKRVDVQVVGDGFQVNGVLMIGRFERLSDWLNMQQGWVDVENGYLFRPGHEDATPPRSKSSQYVRLDQVVLVGERRQPQRARASGAYIQKERRRVNVVARGYMLRGYVHLHHGASMKTFLDTSDPRFLPMTDVVIRWLTDDTLVSHHQFALVNREQLISVADEAERDEAEVPADDGLEVESGDAIVEAGRWYPRSA